MYTQIHTPTVIQGGLGLIEPVLRIFDMLQLVFRNDFALSGKALIFSTRWGLMGGGAARGLWRHQQWSPSWLSSRILSRIRNQDKTARNGNFLCLTWKITQKWALCIIFATRFTFIIERSWKNMYFHSKMARPPATYDVISCNHRNSPPLNLSHNAREGYTNSYWKRQVLMFYRLGKNSEKHEKGGGNHRPPAAPFYVRGLNSSKITGPITQPVDIFWWKIWHRDIIRTA